MKRFLLGFVLFLVILALLVVAFCHSGEVGQREGKLQSVEQVSMAYSTDWAEVEEFEHPRMVMETQKEIAVIGSCRPYVLFQSRSRNMDEMDNGVDLFCIQQLCTLRSWTSVGPVHRWLMS